MNDKNNTFPVFKSIYESFGLFFDNMASFLLLGSIFSVIFMVVNFISGQSLACINNSFNNSVFCFQNIYLVAVSSLFLWIIVCIYMRNWCQIAIMKKHKFSFKNIVPNMADLKIFGIIIVFFITVSVAFGSGFLLFIRNPNPDWKIELMFFSFVSLGFFVPLFATPILSFISFGAEGEKMPKIKELWLACKGKNFVIFISFASVVLISFLISVSLLQYFIKVAGMENIFIVVIAEFLYNIVLMFVATIYMNYCYVQKKFLFERS